MNSLPNYQSKYEFDEMILQIENDSPLQNFHRKNSSAIKNLNLFEINDEELEEFTLSAKSLQEVKVDSKKQ